MKVSIKTIKITSVISALSLVIALLMGAEYFKDASQIYLFGISWVTLQNTAFGIFGSAALAAVSAGIIYGVDKEAYLNKSEQYLLTESIKDENTVKMGTFANALGGKRIPKGSELTIAKTAHPYIRVRDMTKPKVVELTDDFMYVEESDFHKISRYIVDAGDLIISIVGTVGAVALVGETLDKANLTENCAKIANIKGYSPEFLYYFLKSEYGQKEIASGTVGEVQAKLPLKNILEIKVPVLSMQEQEAVVEKLRIVDEKIEREVQYYNKMESIKAGMMHDLLSGLVDVTMI